MKFIALLFAYIFVSQNCFSQEQGITIDFNITDSNSTPLHHAYIKIFQSSKKRIIRYFNSGEKKPVQTTENIKEIDTLIITITHIGYKPFIYQLPITDKQQQYRVHAILSAAQGTLDEVVVASKSYWQNGDTSFYRVNAYTNGTERKLKDVIANLPQFSITNEGKLLFKNKLVSKITIEHQELMADKVDLLLNNFPVHVLEKIEAIENQSENKLLQGLTTGSQTVVNLKIKKQKLKTAFGDIEAGAGLQEQFLLKATAIALYGNVKSIAISNNNNIGNGLGEAGRYEITTAPLRIFEQGKMNLIQSSEVSALDQRMYIRNKRFDNRVQLNTKLGKKRLLHTEGIYISDNMKQHISNNNLFVSDSSFIQRNANSKSKINPATLKLAQKTELHIGNNRSLKLGWAYFSEKHSAQQIEDFNFLNIPSISQLSQQQRTTSITTTAEITHRTNASRANVISAQVSFINIQQQSYSQSPMLAQAYMVDSIYQKSSIHFSQKATHILFSSQWLTQKHKWLLQYQYWQPRYHSMVSLQTNEPMLLDSTIENLGSLERYGTHELIMGFSRKAKWVVPINLFAQLGTAALSNPNVITNPKTQWLPITKLGISHTGKLNTLKNLEWSIDYRSEIPPVYKLRTSLFPQQADGFSRFINYKRALESINATALFSQHFKKPISSIFGSMQYSVQFQSPLSSNSVNALSNQPIFSLISKPSSNFNIALNYLIKSFRIQIAHNSSGFYTQQKDDLNSAKIRTQIAFAEYNLKRGKKFAVKIASTLSKTKFLLSNNERSYFPEVLNWTSQSNATYRIKYFVFESTVSTVQNISGKIKANALIADAGIHYTPSGTKWSGSVFFYNLTNAKNYTVQQVSTLYQTTTNIPLLRRSAFISFYFKF